MPSCPRVDEIVRVRIGLGIVQVLRGERGGRRGPEPLAQWGKDREGRMKRVMSDEDGTSVEQDGKGEVIVVVWEVKWFLRRHMGSGKVRFGWIAASVEQDAVRICRKRV